MGENSAVESVFGFFGFISSIFYYISPVFPFIKILQDKINYNYSPTIQIIFSFINCIFWIVYGLVKKETIIYITNSFGSVITIIWITIYLIYFGKKYFFVSLIINILILSICITIPYLFYYIVEENYISLISFIFNILMYTSPLENIIKAIKMKNIQIFPIFSSIGIFVCSICWLIFGISKKDRYLILSNSFGIFFSIIQVVICIIYYL